MDMEAPKKLYLSDFTDTTEAVFYVKKDNTKKTDVEYTRTDAFIEKACEGIEHPTGGELLHVLNKGHEQGWKDAVEKACKYLKTSHEDIGIRYIRGHEVEDEIEIFKNYMEGQQ